jgi:hypothetical protein
VQEGGLFHRCSYLGGYASSFELSTGAPPGTHFACTENGWITSDVFTRWLKYFIHTTKPNKETKVLLLLDGHITHTKNHSSYQSGKREWGDTAVPPSILQPLHVDFLKQLSVKLNQACDERMRQHLMRKTTQFQITEFLGKTYGLAACVGNAVTGFARTGVWPDNPNVFQDSDFAASTN